MLLSLLAACAGDSPYQYSGSPVWETFPFDGQRTWEFVSTDTTLPYKLIATSDSPPEVMDGANVYTVDYWTHCVGSDPNCVEGDSLRRLLWSSTTTDGARIHGWSVGAGLIQEIDPPIQVAFDVMEKGEVAESDAAGAHWESTLVGIEACPVTLSNQWDECQRFDITTDAADGYPIAGSYWTVSGNGFAAMEIVGDTGQWKLSAASCEPADECDGTW